MCVCLSASTNISESVFLFPCIHIIYLRVCVCVCSCSPPDVPCASGSLWDPMNCVCVSTDAINYSEPGKCA